MAQRSTGARHGASYPYHYQQPPPLQCTVDSSASTTFSRTPTRLSRATEPLHIVVSSPLFILPLYASVSLSVSFLLPFRRPLLLPPAPTLLHQLLPRLPSRLLCPVFTDPRRLRGWLCSSTVRAAFFRDEFVTRMHRSPLFASHSIPFAFLPSSSLPLLRRGFPVSSAALYPR